MQHKKRVLLIEDDKDICELVRVILRAENFSLDVAHDGRSGLERILSGSYHIVILDLMLPELDGWDVCKKARQNLVARSLPIIMLTAKNEERDKVIGLDLGADDYIAKPFSPREFLARVKALLRRSSQYNEDNKWEGIINCGSLSISPQGYKITCGGKKIPLTRREFELFMFLLNSKGKTLKREQLLEQVWGYDYFGDARTVDEHIKRIRQKIAAKDPEHTYIQTVWGVGYKLEVKRNEAS